MKQYRTIVVADHHKSVFVCQVIDRKTGEVHRPPPPSRSVPGAAPGDSLCCEVACRPFAVGIGVHADEGEGPAGRAFHERALVGMHLPARVSPLTPELQQDHPAAVIGETQERAVQVLGLDLGRRMARDEGAELARSGPPGPSRRWFRGC